MFLADSIASPISINGILPQDVALASNEVVDYETSRKYPITLKQARDRALRSIKRERSECGSE